MDVPATLIAAVILVESGGVCNAYRPEPGYQWLWDNHLGGPFRGAEQDLRAPHALVGQMTNTAELWGQRMSWSSMQIMGATARELGFQGWFTELCGPLGVEYGTRYLERLAGRHFRAYGWEGVIAAYNSGSPVIKSERVRKHVEKVMRKWAAEKAAAGGDTGA